MLRLGSFFIIFLFFIKFWVIPSVVVSVIKKATEECQEVYPVEIVFNGNFFCPEKK